MTGSYSQNADGSVTIPTRRAAYSEVYLKSTLDSVWDDALYTSRDTLLVEDTLETQCAGVPLPLPTARRERSLQATAGYPNCARKWDADKNGGVCPFHASCPTSGPNKCYFCGDASTCESPAFDLRPAPALLT